MSIKLLLTSFQTWLPHQTSNSSDDLLEIIQKRQSDSDVDSLFFLRNLPVNTELATHKVIETIKRIKPQGIICCGMAESREKLTIESNAVCGEDCIFTKVNLNRIVNYLVSTKVSNNAGKFVCEGLYYQVLKYAQTASLNILCIFVHIPTINAYNIDQIKQDFITIIRFIGSDEN